MKEACIGQAKKFDIAQSITKWKKILENAPDTKK